MIGKYYIALAIFIAGIISQGVTYANDSVNSPSQFIWSIESASTPRPPDTVRSRCRRFLHFVDRAESEFQLLKRDFTIDEAIKRGEPMEKPKDYQPSAFRYENFAMFMAGLNGERAVMNKLVTSKNAHLLATELDSFRITCTREEAVYQVFVEFKESHGLPDVNVHPCPPTKQDKDLMKRMFPEEVTP